MKLNPDNDVYQGDLSTLNIRKQAWSNADKTSIKYRNAAWIVLAVGFCVIVFVMLQVREGTTKLSQLARRFHSSLSTVFTWPDSRPMMIPYTMYISRE